jgi:DNA repair exonuclease SbcCD nuclease subunit
MKLAIISDTHCGARNSSDIFINYQERFYNEVFFPYLLENDIKHILHLGDYYDNRKFINFKALHANRMMFLSKLREYGITMDIIPGNHDTYYKNTNDLNALKELLGHYMNEVNIIMTPRVMTYGSMDIALLPWIAPDNEKVSFDFVNNTTCPTLAGHLEINGFDMHVGMPCHEGVPASLFEKFDLVLSGHFHTKSTKGNISYLGSQFEFFWSDVDDPKYFHILDTETKQLTAVRNPITIYKKIVYDDTKTDYLHYNLDDIDNKFVKVVVVNKSDTFTFDRFIDRIQNRKIHELKIAESFQEFVGENVSDDNISVEDTQQLLYSYVEAVDTDLDKDRIKNEMHSLMIEAQTLEIS